MNFRRGGASNDPEINLIPLIDVLLVILIFLMVTTTYSRFSELQINLPEAKGAAASQLPKRLDISIDAHGAYSLNNSRITAAGASDLAVTLQRAAVGMVDPVVMINADAEATHQSVIRVMDAARRAGLTRVTFVTTTDTE
ncbi:MAG: biopolymer transporter ExbD [Betaproteobacteria bacterium]|nr:MAG: biopolymer transporter ExbD [Betaproteobacteria bacterium]